MSTEKMSLNQTVEDVLTKESSWKAFWEYFAFLVDSQEEPRMKSCSGMLTVQYMPQGDMQAELGGYDTLTMKRHEYVCAQTEEALKEKIIVLFETERKELLERESED